MDLYCETFDFAELSPYIESPRPPRKTAIRGALYSDGVLIPQSQRSSGGVGRRVIYDDPLEFNENVKETLDGTWLYAGHFMRQFGHFILESLPTLWPLLNRKLFDEIDGVVYSPFTFGREISSWHRELIGRLSEAKPVKVVANGCKFERVMVPERPVKLNESVHPRALEVWDSLVRKNDDTQAIRARKLFLSRNLTGRLHRSLPNDDYLEEIFEGLGFLVVRPERLPISQQIELISSATHIAGLSGSALHASAFAPSGCSVIEIGDLRSSSKPIRMQAVLNRAKKHWSHFIPTFVDPDGLRDLQKTRHALADVIG